MMRNTTHENWVGLVFISRGERYLQNLGCYFRILVKHFIEVTHPKKQDGVGMVFFDPLILLHHRSFLLLDALTFCRNDHSIELQIQVFKMRL